MLEKRHTPASSSSPAAHNTAQGQRQPYVHHNSSTRWGKSEQVTNFASPAKHGRLGNCKYKPGFSLSSPTHSVPREGRKSHSWAVRSESKQWSRQLPRGEHHSCVGGGWPQPHSGDGGRHNWQGKHWLSSRLKGQSATPHLKLPHQMLLSSRWIKWTIS